MGQQSEGLPLQNKRMATLFSKAPGLKNVTHPALTDKSKLYLFPLHIKLGLIKVFVKAVDKYIEGFGYLRQKFPQISEVKKKEGISVGPQITELFKDHGYSTKLNSTERRNSNAFENICQNFLGN
jgi:hypothetical protein